MPDRPGQWRGGVLDSTQIIVRDDQGDHYHLLQKYQRSNQDTCLNQRPIVQQGDQVIAGQVLANGRPVKAARSPWVRTA